MFDGSGQPDGEMVDRSGQPDERNSSNAQIRTLLEEQRQTIIAEYREKVSHHELQAAHAEEERRLLQGQLWQQKLESREARQQSLTGMEELLKFQSSAFDTIENCISGIHQSRSRSIRPQWRRVKGKNKIKI